MRLILSLILALPLAAQTFPVELMRRPGLTRGGLAAGVNLTGGVDTQSIASLPPGTATLVRGANTGASTDDPTVSLAGWTFDSGDQVSGLPAKGAAWTTTNCSGVECYTLTSAGTEYINGVARRNLFRGSTTPCTQGYWGAGVSICTATDRPDPIGGTSAAQFTNTYQYTAVAQSATLTNGATYVISVWAKRDTGTNAISMYNDTDGQSICTYSPTSTWTRYSCSHTITGATGAKSVTFFQDRNAANWTAVDVYGPQIELAASASAYQKTTDSREWALETPGNYTGLLTWWGRWNRALGPGEVLNNYRAWIRPRVNAKGNTLP